MLRAAVFPAVLRRNDELLAQSSRLSDQLEIAMYAATTYEKKLNAGKGALDVQLPAPAPLQSLSRHCTRCAVTREGKGTISNLDSIIQVEQLPCTFMCISGPVLGI